jgi:Leucine rich repeat/Leucine Rich repeats (2 copies)
MLFLFSIGISKSKQAETECLMGFVILKCDAINKVPISDWSFVNQKKFKWSEIHQVWLLKNRIKSFKQGVFTKFTNAHGIFLRQNELTAIDLNEFENNTKLRNLDVGSNQISEIKHMKNSTVLNVTKLWIQNNKVTDISELCKMTKLVLLNLSGNRRLDFSKVMFNCWSELTTLILADTNLKNLNHDYRSLTGCNKLDFLNLMDNNLEMLCLEKFPALPRLTELFIRNNSLINLDVLGLKRKCQNLSEICMTGNNWSCDYYKGTLKAQLKESNINAKLHPSYSNEAHCLQNPVPSEVKSCPRIDGNSTRFQHHEDIKDPKLTNVSKTEDNLASHIQQSENIQESRIVIHYLSHFGF